MLSASVAQNPTIAVSEGQNTLQNCPDFSPPSMNLEGCDIIAPKPPVWLTAQPTSTRHITILIGALYDSSQRIESVPCTTKYSCSAQKTRKQIHCAKLMPSTGSGSPTNALPVRIFSKV